MVKIGGFQDYIMNKIKSYCCFFINLYLNLFKVLKNIFEKFLLILSLTLISNIYCSDVENNKNNIKQDNGSDNEEDDDDEDDDEKKEKELKKKKELEEKKLKEEKKKEKERKKQEKKEIEDLVKSLKKNNDSEKDIEFKNKVIENVKNREEKVIKNNLKKKSKKKKSSFVTSLEKKVEKKNKEIIAKNNTSNEENLKDHYKELKNEYIRKEIERIIEIPKQQNLSKNFEEKLIEINTKYNKEKYLKIIKPVESIEFLGLDFFSLLLYLANLKKDGYIYEIMMNIININWGIVVSTGIEGGMSFIKKNNIKTIFPFVNLTFSFRYNKRGNLKFLIGASKVVVDDEGNYQIPMWWGITPINVNLDVYKFNNIPLKLFLNIEVLFKRIITADLKDCKDMINVFPYNNVSPYLRDKGELNIFDVFLGIKVALGFKYIF